MSTSRVLALVGALVLPLAAVGFGSTIMGGCVNTDAATSIVQVTGVVVQARTLTAQRGCGTGDGQVFKYVALLTQTLGDAPAQPLQVGLFDCFADAVFVNLATNVSNVFGIAIYAFDQARFQALDPALVAAASSGDIGRATAGALAASATWSTACQAVQYGAVESLASCGLLAPTGPSTFDAGADGGGDAARDGAPDVADGSPPDSTPDAPPDAPLDAQGPDGRDAGDAASDAPVSSFGDATANPGNATASPGDAAASPGDATASD